jgi:hypothetical protein
MVRTDNPHLKDGHEIYECPRHDHNNHTASRLCRAWFMVAICSVYSENVNGFRSASGSSVHVSI